MRRIYTVCLVALLAGGCAATTYTLVGPSVVAVANNSLSVRTDVSWNRLPGITYDIKQEESWSLNGPALDLVTFMGGIDDGSAIAKQRQKDDRQVPVFKATMSPPELVSMIESYYRIKAGVSIFETTSVKPVTFLGQSGIQIDYRYIAGDEVKRQGRSVLAVVDKKLYLMALDGTELHYFPSALPEFEAMVASASIT